MSEHAPPCPYNDSIAGNPDSDFCLRLPTCPGYGDALKVAEARVVALEEAARRLPRPTDPWTRAQDGWDALDAVLDTGKREQK